MEIRNIRSSINRVGNYLRESTSQNIDALKNDRRTSLLQDEINDAYRMLGYLFYTEMKTAISESPDWNEVVEKSADIISRIDEKCKEVEQVKKTIPAEKPARNAASNTSNICSVCGAELDKGAKFCGYCGNPVIIQ